MQIQKKRTNTTADNEVSGIKKTPDQNGQWYQHLLTLFAIFVTTAIPKAGTNFHIMFIWITFVYCAWFVLHQLV